jgi:hypothetical protein
MMVSGVGLRPMPRTAGGMRDPAAPRGLSRPPRAVESEDAALVWRLEPRGS